MVNREGEWTLLDHALNAVLMLAYVALRQGDAVGMLAFSDRIHAYVPPRGGARQMNHLLHASFDRFPALVESRYDLAFLHLSRKCRKRTLVVLITNLIDEVNAEQIQSYLGTLGGRHLPLCVLLQRPTAVCGRGRSPRSSRRRLCFRRGGQYPHLAASGAKPIAPSRRISPGHLPRRTDRAAGKSLFRYQSTALIVGTRKKVTPATEPRSDTPHPRIGR